MLVEWFLRLSGGDPVLMGLLGGIVIATLNTLGALLVVVWRNPTERQLDGMLGFAAGVMLAAAFTSLLVPAATKYGLLQTVVGFLIGVVVIDRGEVFVPHAEAILTGRRRLPDGVREGADMRAVVLFILAITLHNLPEGLAVGVGFGSGNVETGIALMLAIGLQNIPEGLAVSIAARNAGLGSLYYAAVAGVRAGVVEIPVALLGAWAVQYAEPLLPYAMGFAAGGMLYVISAEIVPATHHRGHARIATAGTMVGVITMLSLDVGLAA